MLSQNIGVYYDSDTVRYHLSCFKNFKLLEQCSIYGTIDLLASEYRKCKIAVLHIPYPFHFGFNDTVQRLLTLCDHIFIVGTELHPPIVDFIVQNDNSKISYYICGFLNFKLENSNVHQFMDWFETSTYFYKHWLPEILTRLKPYEIKDKSFDILLGRKKQHRDYLYQLTKQDPHRHIVTYFNDSDTTLGKNDSEWIWEWTGLQMNQTPTWTVDSVQYYGHDMSLSQVIPINVYNNTAYSVIAETCWQDYFTFYTEKTAKPIIAKRLFIAFAGQNYLSNLRKLGFLTFDSIVDESYDTEADPLIRWGKAWNELRRLSDHPQEEILQKIQPIVEHNFKVMMNSNWLDSFINQLEQDVVRIISD